MPGWAGSDDTTGNLLSRLLYDLKDRLGRYDDNLDLADLHRRGVEAFFRCFYQFWGNWADQNHLLLVCAFVSYLKERAGLWRRAADFLQGHQRINYSFEKQWDTEKGRHALDPPNYANLQGKVLPTLSVKNRRIMVRSGTP